MVKTCWAKCYTMCVTTLPFWNLVCSLVLATCVVNPAWLTSGLSKTCPESQTCSLQLQFWNTLHFCSVSQFTSWQLTSRTSLISSNWHHKNIGNVVQGGKRKYLFWGAREGSIICYWVRFQARWTWPRDPLDSPTHWFRVIWRFSSPVIRCSKRSKTGLWEEKYLSGGLSKISYEDFNIKDKQKSNL